MECRRCGTQISADSAFCSACGEPATDHSRDQLQSEVAPATPTTGRSQRPPVTYAGFWLRAFAWLIDIFILSIVSGIFILAPLMPRAGISPDNPWAMFNSNSRQVLAINLLVMMAQWVYWALLESSPWQATLGKRILGLYVTDLQGKRISFARASGRFFAMMISTLTIGIGYVMAGFTPRKQALHDMIAECLVLKKTSIRL